MFNRFIKKSSKFFAVVLTATLAFSPLSYAQTPASFTDFLSIIQSDGTVQSVNVEIDEAGITAGSTETSLGPVTVNSAVTDITIKSDSDGTKRTIDATDGNNNSGFRMNDGQTTTIKDITLQNFKNPATDSIGGAIYNYKGTLNISNSKFQANEADYGGAIYTKASSVLSNVLISDSEFINNKAKEVGALGVMRQGVLTNVDFKGNQATNTTEYAQDGGAGALFLGSESYTTITNGTFEENTSGTRGGALSTRKFDSGNNSAAKLDILGTTFTGNSATVNGGAIDNYFYGSATEGYEDGVYINGATFEENTAKNGGAIYNHKDTTQTGKMYINNTAFTGNTATTAGGAIYNEGNIVMGDGVQFVENSAKSGGAIYNAATGNIVIGDNAVFSDNSAQHGSEPYSGSDIKNLGYIEIGDNAQFTRTTYQDPIVGDAYDVGIYSNAGSEIKIGDGALFKNVSQALNNEANINTIGDNATFNHNGSAITNFGGTYTIGDNATFKDQQFMTLANKSNGSSITVGKNATFTGNRNPVFELTEAPYTYAYMDGNGAVANNNSTNSSMSFGDGFSATENYSSGKGTVYNGTATSEIEFKGSANFTDNVAQDGVIYNKGGIVKFGAAATFSGNNDGADTPATIADVYNEGEVQFNGEATSAMEGGIKGTGTTKINAGTVNFGENATLEQNTVTIEEDATLTANAAKTTVTTGISNGGLFKIIGSLTETAVSFNNNILQNGVNKGTTTVSGVNIDMGVGTTGYKIKQYGLNIDENTKLAIDLDNLDVQNIEDQGGTFVQTNTITNNGELILTLTSAAKTLTNNIIGTGKVTFNKTFSEEAEITTSYDIEQDTVTVDAGYVFKLGAGKKLTANSLQGAGTVENNNENGIELKLLKSSDLANIKGTGTTSITFADGADEEIDLNVNGKEISQTINLTGNKSLFFKGTLASGSAMIINNYLSGNSLEITKDFDPKIVVNNYADSSLTQGIVNVMYKGQVNTLTNNGGIVNIVNIDPDKTDNEAFVINDLTVAAAAYQSTVATNNLNIGKTEGTAVGGMATLASGKTISYQNVKVSSGSLDVTAGAIASSAITVEENGIFTATAGTITDLRNATDGTTTDAAIVNDGTYIIKGGAPDTTVDSLNNITNANSKGNFIVDGNIRSKGAVDQEKIIVNSAAKFTVDSEYVTTTDGIENEGVLVLKSSDTAKTTMTNANAINTKTTNGETQVETSLTNTADINQNKFSVLSGDTINSGVIKSTTVFVAAGASLTTTNEIDTYGDGEYTNGKIQNEGTFTIKDVEDVLNNNKIEGTTGVFKLEKTKFTNTENGDVAQDSVEVDADSQFISDVNKVNTPNAIKNAGKVTFTGGTSGTYVDNISSVTALSSAYGETVFDAGSFINNKADVTQSTITVKGTVTNSAVLTATKDSDTGAGTIAIDSTGKLTSSAGNLIAEKYIAIADGGELVLTGGTNSNLINIPSQAFGTLTIDGDVINIGDVGVSTVTVNTGVTLTNNNDIGTNYLTGSTVINNNLLGVDLLDDKGYDLAELTGNGVTYIYANSQDVNMNVSGKTIDQVFVYFYGDKHLTVDGGTGTPVEIKASNSVGNHMTGDSLELVNTILDTPLFINTSGSHVIFQDGSGVNGVIQNNGGTNNATIDFLSNGFTTKDDITSTNTTDITKNILNIGDATNAAVFNSSHTVSYQTITVSSGTMTMNAGGTDGTIDNSSIEVEANGKLIANASNITHLQGSSIVNDGVTEFYAGTNYNAITGTGTLEITPTGMVIVTNAEDAAISQKDINIKSGTFIASANDITTTDGIVNNAVLVFTSTSTKNMTNDDVITGDGNLQFNYNLTNEATINQKNVTNETGEFVNNAAITASETFTNKDAAENNAPISAKNVVNEATGDFTNNSAVSASETVDNAGKFVNAEAGTVSAKDLANSGDFINLNTVTVDQTITNAVTGTITSSGTITAASVENRGLIVNKEEAEINADNGITNYGKVRADNASGIHAVVYNNGDGSTTGVYEVHGGTITKNVNGAATDKATVNVLGNVGVDAGAVIAQNTVNLGDGTDEAGLKLYDESSIRASKLVINDKATLNTINGKIGTVNSDGELAITAGAKWNFELDVDLKAGTGDSLTNVTAGAGSVATIKELGLMSDKAELTTIKIADANIINDTSADGVVQDSVYTSNLKYKVTARGESDATYLDIIADGYGGLPNAIYDGVSSYSLTETDDYVTKWINDPTDVQHNFLKSNLTITGNNNNLLTTTGVDGIIVSSGTAESGTTLKIKDLQSMQGFKNAITVDEDGALYITDQTTGALTFSGNTGAAVVTSGGTAWMDNVKFSSNTVTDAVVKNGGEMRLSRAVFGNDADGEGNGTAPIDVLNEGELYIGDASGSHQASIFAKGIAGKGDLRIDGVTLDMTNAYISQESITLSDNDYSGLTTKVANLTYGTDTTREIYNDSDNLVLIGDASGIDLNTSISGLGSTVLTSTMTIKKNIEQNALTIGDGTGAEVIVDNSVNVFAKNITVTEDSILNANADNVNTASNGKIANSGVVEFTGGTNKNKIDGTGSTVIDGNVINVTGATINQSTVTVTSGNSFTAYASDITTTGAGIVNEGALTYTGGINNNVISGDGDLTIIGAVENNNAIDQDNITITEDGSLKTNADSLVSDNPITNNGGLEFIGGTNLNDIDGTGEMLISGAVTNGNVAITQDTITVSQTGIFTTNINSIATTNGITSNGLMEFVGTGSNDNVITGTGTIKISGYVVNNDKDISQRAIDIASTGAFDANADNIKTTDGIANEGVFKYTGGTNTNVITGAGAFVIDGTVKNSTGTAVSQDTITVNSGKSFEANASDLTAANGVTNAGAMTFTGGVNNNDIDGAGDLTIAGNVLNATGKTIDQNTITVNADKRFEANADDITTDNGIANAGILVFNGGTNDDAITGTGILGITGDVIGNAAVTQDKVVIIENAVFTSTASAINAANGIINDGKFVIDSGIADTNGNAISGAGKLEVTGNTALTNNAAVSQKNMEVFSGSRFITNADNLKVENAIANAGVVEFNNGTNTNAITGAGSVNISGDVINALGATVNQSSVTVNSGSSWTAYASDITTTVGIVNDGTVNYTGGVNISTITRTGASGGVLNVTGDMLNTAAITQQTIDIVSEYFDNARGSAITAATVSADTQFFTDAADITADSIQLKNDAKFIMRDDADATLGAVISGTGDIVKVGDSIVTLTGANTYNGYTAISEGSLQISAANNISDGDGKTVYFDGGSLITTADMQLNSDFVGTYSEDGTRNDVTVEVTGVAVTTMTANSNIYGSANLVKQGSGMLDLQMDENYYAGDTEIQEGKVRGTTANILGKVIGTGDATSAVEFYDATGDVELNEIDTTNYIGTFEKTGNASMTVEKNFKAIDADITAGTFIINNDATMGGSGSTFEVTNDMTVTDALLKGYGNITVGNNLIIGNAATFAPGNSTTTFKVAGNMIFENNSTYDVEIGQFSPDAAGTYNDKTTVTGDTTIDAGGKLVINNLEGKYYQHETINLIEAGGTLTNNGYVSTGSDTYTDEGDHHKVVDGTITFKDFDASDLRDGYDTRISTRVYVDGSTLKVDLERKASEYESATEFSRSHNEQQAAEAIDRLSALSNEGDITTVLDKMEDYYYYNSTYNLDSLKVALNDIAGVIHANSTNLSFFNAKAEHVYDKIKERTTDAYPCNKFHDKIWGQYYYNYNSVNENSNSPKYTSSVNGFLVGFDMTSAKNWTIGAMAGYGSSELKQRDDKTTMDDINLGFYGGYVGENWDFKGMLLGGYEQYKTDRTIHFLDERRVANSEHTGYSGALDLEAAYKIALNGQAKTNHKLFLKPFIGAIGSYMTNSGYKEKGAQSLDLKVESYDNFAAEARAGVGISGKAKKFNWYAKAGVRRLLTDESNEIETSLLNYSETTKMNIKSAEVAGVAFTGGLGADYQLNEDWTLFANALSNLSGASDNYYANVGLSYKFGCKEGNKRINEERMKTRVMRSTRLGNKPTFVFGTDKLNESGAQKLKLVARELEDKPEAEVIIEGHTDNIGSDEVNQRISEERATAAAGILRNDYNVKNEIAVVGKGKREPIASNDTEEGRAQNRRIEVIINESQDAE